MWSMVLSARTWKGEIRYTIGVRLRAYFAAEVFRCSIKASCARAAHEQMTKDREREGRLADVTIPH